MDKELILSLFNEGQRCYINGGSVKDCPYKDNTEHAKHWLEGYWSV